ncbi:3-keto-5-aminohexanoate cleavage protein [Chloroflexota bacterium]
MPWIDHFGNSWRASYDPDTEEAREARLRDHFPAPWQPRMPLMDKKVCIEATIPGWQAVSWYRDRGVNNMPPLTVEEQVDAIAACIKAGASIIHTHPRDGGPTQINPKLLARIMDAAFDKAGDFVTMNHCWCWDLEKSPYIDYISDAQELLELGKGNKYNQGSVIMTWGIHHYGEGDHGGQPFVDGMKFLEENSVKPIYQMHMVRFDVIKRVLFDSGVSKWKPFVININTGKHEDEQINMEPWAQLETIKNIYMLKDTFGKDVRIGIYAGGRNWLPVTMQGVVQGVDLIRGGPEDQFYLWPHRDDISTRPQQMIEMLATLANLVGREIATPKEVREICGMKYTS